MQTLTWTRVLLARFGLTTVSLAVFPIHLRRRGVTQPDASDDAFATRHRARRPRGPMAPAAVLLDCMKTQISINHMHGNPNMMQAADVVELTAFVAFLCVTVSRLDRRAVAVAVDSVAGASALLNASAAGHRTVRPFRPGRPAVHTRIIRLKKTIRGNM